MESGDEVELCAMVVSSSSVLVKSLELGIGSL